MKQKHFSSFFIEANKKRFFLEGEGLALKLTIKKNLIRVSHSLIHMHRLLIEKVDVVYFYKDK